MRKILCYLSDDRLFKNKDKHPYPTETGRRRERVARETHAWRSDVFTPDGALRRERTARTDRQDARPRV